jgi:inorganic pyrophosphatase
MEINKETPWNPIKQDTKNGKLRDYPMASVVHYGAVPQTYEHPKEEDDITGWIGDGDPVDLLDISDKPAKTGDVYKAKILGALAMKDDDAADWKIIAIRADDPAAATINGAEFVCDIY